MKCDKCLKELDTVKPWTIKTLGLAGNFTWNFCEDHYPKVDIDRPYTKDQIETIFKELV
jgi:hypothetical protein